MRCGPRRRRNISVVFIVVSLSIIVYNSNYGPRLQLADDVPHEQPRVEAVMVLAGAAGVAGDVAVGLQNISIPTLRPLPESRRRTATANCDEECQRFRLQLQSWPQDKPKAAVYFLIQKSSLTLLRKALAAFDRYFNDQFSYPVIMFFEEDLNSASDRRYIQSMTNSTVFFQLVKFEVPAFLTQPIPKEIRGKNRVYDVGYRHMCRFHAKTVYDQAILDGLDYAWRLDHDSFILRQIDYDVFKLMKDRDITYGFVKVYFELPMWTKGLWEAAKKYIANNNVTTQFFNKWPRNRMYYNNFEISKLSLWYSDDYLKFIDYLDREGGIYYHRWGDAPIKSIAVAMFVSRKQTYNFKDIGYQHQFLRRP